MKLVEKHLVDGEAIKRVIDQTNTPTLSQLSIDDGESSDDVRTSPPQQPPFDTVSSMNEAISRIPITQSRIMPQAMWQEDQASSECPHW
jgi:hypothetical protein